MASDKSQKPSLGEELTLTIDRLAYHSGHGVARHNGFVVFVPYTAPGDSVLAKINQLHASYGEARIVKLLKSGPERRKPPCPVAGQCGGCQWQQVNYPEQLRQKQRLLSEALRRLSPEGNLPLHDLIPAPEEFHYRNRIQLHRHGETLGYYAQGSREFVAIEDCWIAEKVLVQNFPALRARAQSSAETQERIEIARLKNGQVQLRPTGQAANSALFSQVHEAQNQTLIKIVQKAVAGRNFDQILDLYCGSGNLTFPLAQALPKAQVTGVELSREMIREAQQESAQNPNQRPISWVAQSVGPFLRQFRRQDKLLVVLDPPRPGCDVVTREALLRLRPEQIVYVSCNPTTLARDLEFLLKNAAYTIESVQGLDMFPQTAHLEVVVSLIAPSR